MDQSKPETGRGDQNSFGRSQKNARGDQDSLGRSEKTVRRGVVGVMMRGEQFLVIRRSQFVAAPGKYCFPGGGIEPGEEECDAMRRELNEELGIDVLPTRRVWQSCTSWGVDLAWWTVPFSESLVLRPDPQEVESVHWFSRSEMRDQEDLLESNLQFLDALDRGDFAID